MAREYAKFRTNIHGDEQWRELSGPAKLLYYTLSSHPTLNYAGVADWRPKRLVPLLDQRWDEDMVNAVAAELESGYHIVVDADSEEVLVRTFIKHDGLLKQPRLAISMQSAFSSVSSLKLRQVIAHEVQKERDREPDLACWKDPRMRVVLDHSKLDVKQLAENLGEGLPTGLGEGFGIVSEAFRPNVAQSSASPTTTATTTTTEASLPAGEKKLKETRLPADWVPTKAHYDLAVERRIDIQQEVDAFRLHAETHDRHAARWNAAFTTWLKKAKPKPTGDSGSWMNRSIR